MCYFQTHACVWLCRLISKCLCPESTHIDLMRTRTHALTHAFLDASTAYNGLEWEGVRDISQHLLPHLPALTSLDLSHNGCGGWTHKPNAHTSAPPWLHDHAGLAEGGSQGEQEFLMRDWRYTDMLTRSPPRRDRRPASRHEHGSPHGGTVDCRSPVGAASQGEAHDMRNGQEEHLCSEHRQCGIDFPGIVALSRSLMRASPSTGIKILNLGCNRLTDACVALVAGALLGTLRGREGEDGDGGDTGEGGGVACGGLSASCEVLRLQCNELTASGAASLSAALPSSRITALDLTDNVIASEGVACIATALAVCGGRMHYLGLGSNSIGDSGMSHLAAALPACVRLRHLDLSDNRIVDEGATHLAAVLGACRALRYLSLCSNQVGDQGAARIADAMLSIRTSVAAGDSAPRHCPGQEAFTASCFADRPDRVGGTSPDTGGTLNTDGTSPGGMSLEVLDIRGNRVGDVCSKRLIAGAPSCCCVRVRF
jgi:hypothetical protein